VDNTNDCDSAPISGKIRESHPGASRLTYNVLMNDQKLWASLSGAAELIDVSVDTILRRAVDYEAEPEKIHLYPCPQGKVRRKKLKLGEGTRQDHRYYTPDLLKWLN
jgi:hypothetical protein